MTRAIPYDRETALEAALTLFWEKGFHATSLKDLEAALKMKPGSIYAAFSSKENLYLEALERYFESAKAGFQAKMETATSPMDGLVEHIHSFANLPPDHPHGQACMLMKTLIDTRSTDPAIAQRSRKYVSMMRDEFAAVFKRAKLAGELPPDADADHLARRFQSSVTALRLELHQGTKQAAVAALAEDMAQEFERIRVSNS